MTKVDMRVVGEALRVDLEESCNVVDGTELSDFYVNNSDKNDGMVVFEKKYFGGFFYNSCSNLFILKDDGSFYFVRDCPFLSFSLSNPLCGDLPPVDSVEAGIVMAALGERVDPTLAYMNRDEIDSFRTKISDPMDGASRGAGHHVSRKARDSLSRKMNRVLRWVGNNMTYKAWTIFDSRSRH